MADTPLTVIRGDGIGPDIVAAALSVLEAAGATFDIEEVAVGKAALDAGVDGEVRRLAAAMVNGQESEIDLMHDILTELGAQTQEESGTTVGVEGSGTTAEDTGHEGEGAEETSGHDH